MGLAQDKAEFAKKLQNGKTSSSCAGIEHLTEH